MEAINQYIDLHGKWMLNLHNFHLNSSNHRNKEHRHHYLEISYVKKGRGCYKVEDKYYDMEEGDVFVLNNIESHVICKILSPDELVNMVIHFEPRFIWSSESSIFDSRYLKIFFDRNENFQNRLDRNNPATHDIRKLLLEIEEEFLNKKSEYDLMIKVKLLNILVNLIRHYGYTTEPGDTSGRRKQDLIFMNKVIDYIDNHLSEDLKLNVLSEIARLTGAETREIKEIHKRSVATAALQGCPYAILHKGSKIQNIDLNIDDSSTIFIGSPVWASNTVPALNSFLEKIDCTGKKFVIFITMADIKNSKKALSFMEKSIEQNGGTVAGTHAVLTSNVSNEDIVKAAEEIASKYTEQKAI